MTERIFITGTDTGVGKTVVTRALARAARRLGIEVVAVKPVESGVDGRGETDALRIARAAGDPESRGRCLYAFEAAVSPHLAAQMEGRDVSPDALLQFLESCAVRSEMVLAEGAGGLLVPLADGVTYGDVIARSGYSLLIVAPNILGTINATLLTIEAARRRNISVIGVVLNGRGAEPLGNRDAIERWGAVSVWGELPTLDAAEDDSLADAAEQYLDVNRLFTKSR